MGDDTVDWFDLRHAYGRATDTPGHLAALESADPEAVAAALDHLEVAVLHQGFPCPATAPAAWEIADVLRRGALDADTRDALVRYLGWVAEGTANAEGMRHFAALIPDLHATLVETFPVVLPLVGDEDQTIRDIAAAACVSHLKTAVLARERPAFVAWLRTEIDHGVADPARHVGYLTELAVDVRDYLTHPDWEVRVAAALSPGLADDDTATDVLIQALERAAASPTVPATHSLAALVKATIARVADFERIAAPAATIAATTSWTGFDSTWGPLLLAAFRGHRAGTPLTRSQRSMLAALVDNPGLWDPQNGSVGLVFKQAGLPFDRLRCRHICQEGAR